jgi:hypothetical protein
METDHQMDEYLKCCQACDTRQPAKWFRSVMGKRVCLHCADYMEMEDAYRPQPAGLPVSRQRQQQNYREPPARWSDRRGRVPHWLGHGKGTRKVRTEAAKRREQYKPDVMDAKVPPRRGR